METVKPSFKTAEVAYIALMVSVIAICAWISIPLTIPVTLQTFGVFVAAGLLGARRSMVVVLVYMALGAIGIPVFSNFTGGLGILLGKTGGYMVGFIFIAAIVGYVSRRFKGNNIAIFASMLLGMAICYAFGTLWFMQVYAASSGAVGLMTVLGWCVFPFIIPDIVKMILAIIVINRVAPRLKID